MRDETGARRTRMQHEDWWIVITGILVASTLCLVTCSGCAGDEAYAEGYAQGWHVIDAPYQMTNVRAKRHYTFPPSVPLELRVEGYTDEGLWFSGGTRMYGQLVTVVVPPGYYDVWLSESVLDLFAVQSVRRETAKEILTE